MFIILNSANLIVDLSAYAHYVSKQKTGVIISCDKAKADGIYSQNSDTFYPLQPINYVGDSHALHEVEEVPEWVTIGNYFYNAGEFYTPDIRSVKLAEVGAACEAAIYSGFNIETSDGEKHFSLKSHDQTELMGLNPLLDALTVAGNLSTPAIPYHADGESCRLWNAADFGAISKKAKEHIFYHRTYCNALNTWIRREDDNDILLGINYGSELPEDLTKNMSIIIATLET